MGLRFQVLGDVQVIHDGEPVVIKHARVRSVLAALLVDLNTVVHTDILVDRVWGEQLPDAPRSALYTYLSRLRQALAGSTAEIAKRSGGYILTADPETVDLHRFRRLCAKARASEDDEAAALFEAALAQWHGEPAGDSPWMVNLRVALGQERFLARLDYHDVQLRRGHHEELISELGELVDEHPLDERLAAQFMLALHRGDRRDEALQHYRRVRRRLADELGMDPGPALRQAYQVVNPVVPRQLPARVAGFTGRVESLKSLNDLLPGNTVVISALSGMAGIGKTTLAVHWAHQVAGHFPDGQLYLDLRGFDASGRLMRPAEAIRALLDALDVPPLSIPAGLDEQAALYRELVADRRMLIVLDNARDAAQVRPLLPDSAGCLVVVTSRDQLADLVTEHNAQPITLDVLNPAEARQLLAERLGTERLEAEPDAVTEIIARCAHLPLALAVTAAHAVTRPAFPLSAVAVELGDDINAVFSWSYRALREPAARAFRSLGLHPAAEFGLAAAASLTGLALATARQVLTELCDASLLTEYLPGRYRFHDLVRAYAASESSTMDTTAVVRMLDHYLHTARHAALLLTPLRSDIQLAEPQPGTVVTDLPDRAAALAWFTTEHRCLATATQYALDYGYPAHCWQLAWALVDFFNRQGHRDEQAHVQQLALAAANQSDDLEGQAHALRGLARASARLRAFDDAYAYLAAALTAREKLGDPHNQAVIHLEFTVTMLLEGRPADAHKHAELALPLDVACGHQHGQSKALSAMGYCQALLGNYQDALGYCHRSLQLHDDSVSLTSKADTLDTIGYCHHNLGDHGQAVEYYRQCLQMGREVDDLMTQGTALARIGDVHWDAGERVAARQAWQEALAVLGDVNPPDSEQLRAKLARQD